MSNEFSEQNIAEQAGSSSANNPNIPEENGHLVPTPTSQTMDFSKMSVEEVRAYANKLAEDVKALKLNGEKGVEILLAWEKGGFAPRKMEKHFLKEKYPNIDFKTPEWQTWVS